MEVLDKTNNKENNIHRADIKRVMREAKEKDWTYLTDWLRQFDDQVRKDYENAFQKELSEAIDNFCLAIAYALHFSEKTKFGEKRIKEFLDDVFISIDMFRTGEYDPEEYKQQLIDSGINIFSKKEEKGE